MIIKQPKKVIPETLNKSAADIVLGALFLLALAVVSFLISYPFAD